MKASLRLNSITYTLNKNIWLASRHKKFSSVLWAQRNPRPCPLGDLITSGMKTYYRQGSVILGRNQNCSHRLSLRTITEVAGTDLIRFLSPIHSNVGMSLNDLNQSKCLHTTNVTNENPFQIAIVVIKKPLISSNKTLWYCNIIRNMYLVFIHDSSWHTAPSTLIIS